MLPVLHARREDWHFTALFSNTPKVHELGKTRDWVVIYFHLDVEPESQCTVVTETRGALKGRRVVRGREGECAEHYAQSDGVVSPSHPDPDADTTRRLPCQRCCANTIIGGSYFSWRGS